MWWSINKPKVGVSMMEPEIAKKIIWYGRKRDGGGVICYVGSNLSYNVLSVF